ncbi:MAG TPA: amidohydrolase family protein, partial [Cyclobacteriaceae bacterium]
MKFRLVYFLFVICFLTNCSSKKQPADTVILGGKIYTANDLQPEVEAVVVRGEKIEFAGSEKEAREWVGEKTNVIDLKGKTMTPGFIESHGHIMGLGYNELNLDLMDVKSFEEIVEKVKEAVSKSEPGQWIVGRGWHQDKWDAKPPRMIKGFPVHQMLSAVSPDNPVFLRHASGHAGFANAKAMQLAGVNHLSIEKLGKEVGEGGEII